MADHRIATGIYRTPRGWRLFVRVGGRLKPKRILDPLHARGLVELKALRDDWRTDARRAANLPTVTGAPGTFAADAARYLQAKGSMPTFRERARHVALWVAEFGGRPRASIQPWEIRTVIERWLAHGPKRVCQRLTAADREAGRSVRWVDLDVPLSASQVALRQRALENLWTTLDGRHAYNPAREVEEPRGPEDAARGLPYGVVEAILMAMPDRGRAARGEARKGKVGLTRLRLRAIAYTGFSHGELMRLTSADLHLEEPAPWVWVGGRQKGKGTRGTAQPLVPEGAAALRALAGAGGLGHFCRSGMWKSFQRACQKLGLTKIRPYDLRHSFASEVLEKTGSLTAVQLLMRHRSQRTSLRYGQRAIDPVRAAAIAQLAASKGFQSVTPVLPLKAKQVHKYRAKR